MAPLPSPDDTTLFLFQQHWRVYRILVDQNYLFHREVYARLHEALAEMDRPFRFVDLGCGDAAWAATALKGTKVASYHGIDLAGEAVAVAQRTLANLPCRVSFEVGDFTESLRYETETAEVIWCCLSLHHSRHRAKKAVMTEIRRLLAPGGTFLFYENTRPDGEHRAGWLSRWDHQRTAWTAYDDADWTMMRNHVRAADHPETCSDWHRLADAAGFTRIQELFVAPSDLFRMYALS